MRNIAIALGVLGALIGVFSAISSFVAVGSDPLYSSRLWAGGASLLLAIVAGGAALFMSRRPVAASLVMLGSGIVGFLCINLFYINTFYVLAVPLWILGAVVTLTSTSGASHKSLS